MFSGIIESVGSLQQIDELKKGLRFWIEAPFAFKDLTIGHSIAVNGACLTVTGWKENRFSADLSPETLEKTLFRESRVGDTLNVERPLRLSDRLHGHLVTGHIDGIGRISQLESVGEFHRMVVEVAAAVAQELVQKGSIAVDGISLTLNRVDKKSFEVMVIPETLRNTNLGNKKAGDAVQLELDIIGKYVKRFMKI
jgi:riboflavin synthase